MTQNNGVHANSGATTNTPASSTDASLEARAKNKNANQPKRPWIVALIAVVAVVAIIIGWNVLKPRETATGEGGAADTVTIGLKLAPTNLDIRNTAGSALDQILIGNVYEGLVARDGDNNVVPAIAKTWESNDDGTVYTFHLNEGMTFSNGDELNADDVAWSINELIDREYHDSTSLANFESITAIDANTVELRLSAPYSNLLWTLTGRAGLVFDKDAQYDAKTEAVGSGPYTVENFTANDSVTLKANANYWGSNKAKTDTIVIKYYTDDNAAVNALKSGDVQVLAPINASLADSFVEDSDHYTVQAGDDTDKYVLAFNSTGENTADKRVRQAIRYAINHDEIIASRGGADAALGGPIPSLDPGYEDLTDVYPYDVDKAKELMAEAGYSTDNPLKLTLTYSNTYPSEIGDQLRSQLKEIGIDLDVQIVEFSTWLQDVYTDGNYDLSLVDHNESHDFYQWATPDYYYHYDNKEVQGLYNQAIAATSDEERDQLLAKAARIVSEDAPADWLFNYRVTTAWANGLEGFPVNLNQTVLPLYNVVYKAQ